jgi:hypothetical protein
MPPKKEDDDLEELADLIEEETDVDWPKAKKMLPGIPTGTLLALMGRLGLYVNRMFALEVAARKDAVFFLRWYLQDGRNWENGPLTSDWAPVHGIHILSLIKSPEALELLLDVIRFRSHELGDILTEDAAALLYNFGPEAWTRLREFTTDGTLPIYGRSAALRAMIARAMMEPGRKPEVLAFMRSLMAAKDDRAFAAMVADDLIGLDKTTLPEIKAAIRDGTVDKECLDIRELGQVARGEFDDVVAMELALDTKDPLAHFSRKSILHFQEVERSWEEESCEEDGMDDDFSDEEDGEAGKGPSKNAPCPCGSGKKYKRCCMPGKDG